MFRIFMSFTLLLLFAGCVNADSKPNATPSVRGKIETHILESKALADTKTGINASRSIHVYLPPSYHQESRRYPVLYYIPQGALSLEDGQFVSLLEEAFKRGDLDEMILVTGDFDTPGAINFFGNGSTTGRWLDHIKVELVAFVDANYRTLAQPASRGIGGHFLGGYVAMKLAMFHPETFGSVYALHPVATDTGERPMLYVPDWKEIHAARSFDDLQAPYSAPFVAMAQAHLPNPENPPFYADFIVELENGELVPNQETIRRLFNTFHLADLVPHHAENLKKLRGIGYDWGRNDANQAHVYGARKLTTLMQNYGLEPIAVEHGGHGWDYGFEAAGHINRRMLPFFAQHMVFE